MTDWEKQDARIEAIIGGHEDFSFEDSVNRFYDHLMKHLKLPCDITGIEDFRWEEFYVLGPGDVDEYDKLRQTQPSYQDEFELLDIAPEAISEWMMYHAEDLGAHVRRKSDGKEFYLGLAEVEAVQKESTNYQLLNDYAVFFVNNR